MGDTVRRPLKPNSEFVHALLRHLEAVGFDGAPRLLGVDEQGREILTFVDGEVFVGPDEVGDPVEILSDGRIASAARLIRRFHDATAGTPFAADAEVVCHTDIGQHNIVFRDDEAVAIIDWDEDVGPGPRLLDLGHAAWCLAEVGGQGGEVAEQGRRIRLVCDAYGWPEPDEVIGEIEARFRRALAWHRETRKLEAERIFASMLEWLVANRAALEAGAG